MNLTYHPNNNPTFGNTQQIMLLIKSLIVWLSYKTLHDHFIHYFTCIQKHLQYACYLQHFKFVRIHHRS